jgi:hypothetical protein
MMLYRPMTDKASMQAETPLAVEDAISTGKKYKTQYDELNSNSSVGFTAVNMTRLLDDRVIWPFLVNDAATALASADPQDALLQSNVEEILALDAGKRRLVKLRELSGAYEYAAGAGPATAGRRLINVTMDVELSREEWDVFLTETVAQWLVDHAEPEGDRADVPYRILPDTVKINPEAFEEFEVDENETAQSVGGGPKKPRDKPERPGGNKPGQPGGGMSGAGSGAGAGSGSLGGSGQKQGRRRWTGEQKAAPGPAGGMNDGSKSGGGGGGDNKPAAWNKDRDRDRSKTAKSQEQVNIDKMAPLKSMPGYYSTGDKFFHVPITFTVEIIDPNAPKTPDPSSSAQADGKGTRS